MENNKQQYVLKERLPICRNKGVKKTENIKRLKEVD